MEKNAGSVDGSVQFSSIAWTDRKHASKCAINPLSNSGAAQQIKGLTKERQQGKIEYSSYMTERNNKKIECERNRTWHTMTAVSREGLECVADINCGSPSATSSRQAQIGRVQHVNIAAMQSEYERDRLRITLHRAGMSTNRMSSTGGNTTRTQT